MDYAILRHNGKLYRIQKQPFETEEQAMDRLWYIVNNEGDVSKVILQSLQWMYEKYYKVKY